MRTVIQDREVAVRVFTSEYLIVHFKLKSVHKSIKMSNGSKDLKFHNIVHAFTDGNHQYLHQLNLHVNFVDTSMNDM